MNHLLGTYELSRLYFSEKYVIIIKYFKMSSEVVIVTLTVNTRSITIIDDWVIIPADVILKYFFLILKKKKEFDFLCKLLGLQDS